MALIDQVVAVHRGAFEQAGVTVVVEGVAGPQWVMVDRARLARVASRILGEALARAPRDGRVTVSLERRQEIVELCVSGAPAMAIRLAPAGAAAPAPLPPVARRRVLIIEDHLEASRALAQALTMLGLDVRTAASGAAALEVAREFSPQVVLCDIGLPGMDGHAVARAFAADPQLSGAVLVALSGLVGPEEIARSKAAGFTRHITKPASLETLLNAIAAAHV